MVFNAVYDLSLHKKYPVGTYYDSLASMWYRIIYVLDCDLIRLHFMSLYELDMYNMDKEQFMDWCSFRRMENTKHLYEIFKRIAPRKMNSNRSLASAGRKRGVHFAVSDSFCFKGSGPYRAIIAYGKSRSSVESSSNEYEDKITKAMKRPSLIKDLDGFSFPSYEYTLLSHLESKEAEWRKKHSHSADSNCPYQMERKLSIVERDFTYNYSAEKKP